MIETERVLVNINPYGNKGKFEHKESDYAAISDDKDMFEVLWQ